MPSFTSRLQIKWGKLQFSCTLASCYIYDAHKCINILEWLNRKHNFTVVITLFHTHLLQDTGTEQSSKENTSYHTPSLFSFMCKTPCMQNYRVSFVQPIEWSNWLNITKCSFSVCLEMLMPHNVYLRQGGSKKNLLLITKTTGSGLNTVTPATRGWQDARHEGMTGQEGQMQNDLWHSMDLLAFWVLAPLKYEVWN